MSLPANRLSRRLPKRFPVGATYVIEGRGGARGALRVFSRYVRMPDGRQIEVPVDLPRPVSARARMSRRSRNLKQSQRKIRSTRSQKKFAAGGTD